jgi:hypothetical protein
MGFATLNAFVCNPDNLCHLDSKEWLFNIYYCDLSPLDWCQNGKHNYQNLLAHCGHLTVEDLPPGCYVICAHMRGEKIHTFPVYFQAKCDDHICLKLIPWTPRLEEMIRAHCK